ncbi:MAG TPA: flagellar basal body L-ring protein FlgH [Gammaproteobacteria bacterium]
MNARLIYIVPVLGALLFSGCTTTPRRSFAEPQIEEITYSQPARVNNGSIYQHSFNNPLFEDIKAKRVGDIVIIVLNEQTDASKSASTSTDKSNTIGIENPTLLGAPFSFSPKGSMPLGGRDLTLETDISSSKSFSGEGDSSQSNELSGSVTATVMEVLPNGYLRIQGEKQISINQGEEFIRITGIIRPMDIRTDNSVLSTQVANAKIAYGGNGVVANSNDMGWLARFFNGKWWPF